MTTIDIDEATRNAILAALDERAARLEAQVRVEQIWADLDVTPTEDAQRALVWNIAALHETNMARLQVAEAGEPEPGGHRPAELEADRAKWAAEQTLAEAVPWEPAGGYHDWQGGR